MTSPKQIAKYGLNALLKAGAEKAQCSVTFINKHEMNIELGEFTLFRTTFDTQIGLSAIKHNKKGSTNTNKSDNLSLDKAASEALAIAASSAPDEAHDISEIQPSAKFSVGSTTPKLDKMHLRIKQFTQQVKQKYPTVILMQVSVDFTQTTNCFLNSNGVDFITNKGIYNCSFLFSSADTNKVSSFNYTGFSVKDLEQPLLEQGSIDALLKQSTEQISTRSLNQKFIGEVIITPDCMSDLLYFLARSLSDGPMITNTSVYKDKLNQQIATPLFTLRSHPVSNEICNGYFVTSDGYAAQNSTIVDSGVLKTFLLSLYGSKKTGLDRAPNQGGAFIVDSGETSYDDMVKSVEKGILLSRFSGGYPTDSGDFSGVAKNSYLIENGKIKYPISESMIAGNFVDMLNQIVSISKERVNYGNSILPWIQVKGITISGN